jgi:hypothetical protein
LETRGVRQPTIRSGGLNRAAWKAESAIISDWIRHHFPGWILFSDWGDQPDRLRAKQSPPPRKSRHRVITTQLCGIINSPKKAADRGNIREYCNKKRYFLRSAGLLHPDPYFASQKIVAGYANHP